MKVFSRIFHRSAPFAAVIFMGGACIISQAADEPAFVYNFEDLVSGPLEGQDEWKSFSAGDNLTASPLVVHSDTDPKGYVGQTEAGDKLLSRSWKLAQLGLDGATKIALEFDVCGEGDGRHSIAMLGIGSSRNKVASELPAMAGVMFGQLAIREKTFQGEIHNAFGPNGRPFKPIAEEWYRVRSIWSYVDADTGWVATISVRNLSKKEEEFTPLWFDKQLTLETVPLGIKNPPEENVFSVIALRVGTPGGRLAAVQIFRLAP